MYRNPQDSYLHDKVEKAKLVKDFQRGLKIHKNAKKNVKKDKDKRAHDIRINTLKQAIKWLSGLDKDKVTLLEVKKKFEDIQRKFKSQMEGPFTDFSEFYAITMYRLKKKYGEDVVDDISEEIIESLKEQFMVDDEAVDELMKENPEGYGLFSLMSYLVWVVPKFVEWLGKDAEKFADKKLDEELSKRNLVKPVKW